MRIVSKFILPVWLFLILSGAAFMMFMMEMVATKSFNRNAHEITCMADRIWLNDNKNLRLIIHCPDKPDVFLDNGKTIYTFVMTGRKEIQCVTDVFGTRDCYYYQQEKTP